MQKLKNDEKLKKRKLQILFISVSHFVDNKNESEDLKETNKNECI